LRTLRESDEVVVLSLGTLASLALRKMEIPYVTPNLFFSKEKSPAMDKQSVAFCRAWYKSIDHPLMSYHGVSIGEVLEYDFYFLFIDALRSVEIAGTLLQDSFDAIFIPSLDSQDVWHDACYYTLPSILTYLAAQKGIKVARLERPSWVAAENKQRRNRARQWSSYVFHNVKLLESCALILRKNFGTLVTLLLDRKKARYSVESPIEELVESLRDADGRALKIYPSFVHTPGSISQANRVLQYMKDGKITSRLYDSIVYDEIPLWRVLSSQIDQRLSELVPYLFGMIQWTELFVKIIRPASFVVYQDITPLFRSMCQVLRSRGIPVVLVQHGILSRDLAGFYVMPKVGDIQAVWGEYYRKWHTDRGKPAESQVVTGFPRYDGLFNLPPFDRDRLSSQFGLDPKLKVVLVATEWFEADTYRHTVEEEENYIRLVLRSLKVHGDIQIVVKLHPTFRDRYQRIVSEIAAQEGVKAVIAKDSLWDLIRLSSFVIVSTSSVCVEALILGKPVILVNLTDQEDISGLVQDGLAVGAYSEDDIKRSIGVCMAGDGRGPDQGDDKRSLLFPFIYLADGCASRRVAELIRAKSVRNPESP
jgi:hypothetical protein